MSIRRKSNEYLLREKYAFNVTQNQLCECSSIDNKNCVDEIIGCLLQNRRSGGERTWQQTLDTLAQLHIDAPKASRRDRPWQYMRSLGRTVNIVIVGPGGPSMTT